MVGSSSHCENITALHLILTAAGFLYAYMRIPPQGELPRVQHIFSSCVAHMSITPAAVESSFKYLPTWLHSWIPLAENAIPISFSIPLEKITPVENTQKIKDFPIHIVDLEIAKNINEARFSELGANTYFFESENDYYQDLQKSRFGITTKRAGWDCLRHYELAANGCVLCFRDIDQKPHTCAPHGLNESNCISYNSYEYLINKINSLSPQEYLKLQALTYDWIKNNSTIARAKGFLDSCFKN